MNLELFLKKFYELRDKSPRLFSTTIECENCLYTQTLAYSKNCYYVFTGGWDQDCYYGEFLVKCKNCVDSLKIEACELCYECTDCYQCYNSNFLLNCSSVQDSEYSYGLRDCHHCFLSNNQRHKSFVFKNRQVTKEEYESLVREYKVTHSLDLLYREFMHVCASAIRVNLEILNSENCIGNYISHSKNVYHSFDIIHGEDYLYSEEAGYGKDCCDILIGGQGELNYECVGIAKQSYNCSFCMNCITCVNCELCQTCFNLNDCFGCVYLKGKKFHILNEPYSPEEFKKEKDALRKALIESRQFSLDLYIT